MRRYRIWKGRVWGLLFLFIRGELDLDEVLETRELLFLQALLVFFEGELVCKMMLKMALVLLMVEVNEVFDDSVCERMISQAGVTWPRKRSFCSGGL